MLRRSLTCPATCDSSESIVNQFPFKIDEEVIGRGRYAVVKKCTDEKKTFAAKIIKSRRRTEIKNELEILRLASKHSNIIQLEGIYEINTRELALVLEYANGGDLQTVIERDEQLKTLPQNILLMKEWPDVSSVKLCDFGLSHKAGKKEGQLIAGTADFMAPEVINYDLLTTACDMWSLGVVTFVLVTGGISPFVGETDQETYANITRAHYDSEYVENASEEAIGFISNLLQTRAQKRMTAPQCLEHPFVFGFGTAPMDTSMASEQGSNPEQQSLISLSACLTNC